MCRLLKIIRASIAFSKGLRQPSATLSVDVVFGTGFVGGLFGAHAGVQRHSATLRTTRLLQPHSLRAQTDI